MTATLVVAPSISGVVSLAVASLVAASVAVSVMCLLFVGRAGFRGGAGAQSKHPGCAGAGGPATRGPPPRTDGAGRAARQGFLMCERERTRCPLPLLVSATQAEALDQRPVPVDVGLAQVVEQAPAAADQLEQPAPAVVVVLVELQVLGQVLDALRQHRDLHLGRPRVAFDRGVLRHDLLLDI